MTTPTVLNDVPRLHYLPFEMEDVGTFDRLGFPGDFFWRAPEQVGTPNRRELFVAFPVAGVWYDHESHQGVEPTVPRRSLQAGQSPIQIVSLPVFEPDDPTFPAPGWPGWPVAEDSQGVNGHYEWNGHRDRPTLSPIVYLPGAWSGWVRNGWLTER